MKNPNLYIKRLYLQSYFGCYTKILIEETPFVYSEEIMNKKHLNVLATFKNFEDLYHYCTKDNRHFKTIIPFFGRKRKVEIITPFSFDNTIITEYDFIPYYLYEEYELMTDLTVEQLRKHLTIEQYSNYVKTHV